MTDISSFISDLVYLMLSIIPVKISPQHIITNFQNIKFWRLASRYTFLTT